MKYLAIGIAAAAIAGTTAHAQMSFSGGTVGVYYGGFTDEDADLYGVDGSFVFAVSPGFDTQLDVGYGGLSFSSGTYDSAYIGVHGIYNFASAGRAGAFYEYGDLYGEVNMSAYGVEYQYTSGAFYGEIQLGGFILSDGGATQDYTFAYGEAGYDFGTIDLSLNVFSIFFEGDSLTNTNLRAGYETPYNGIELYAEYGFLSYSYSSETYDHWSIGIEIPFGGNPDTFNAPLRSALNGVLL